MNEKEFIDFMGDAFNTEKGLIYGDFKTMFKILTEEGYVIIKKEASSDLTLDVKKLATLYKEKRFAEAKEYVKKCGYVTVEPDKQYTVSGQFLIDALEFIRNHLIGE